MLQPARGGGGELRLHGAQLPVVLDHRLGQRLLVEPQVAPRVLQALRQRLPLLLPAAVLLGGGGAGALQLAARRRQLLVERRRLLEEVLLPVAGLRQLGQRLAGQAEGAGVVF